MSDENIEIDGIPFTAEELTPEQSQGTREIVTTKIMNGTCFMTQGEYSPMVWSFKTHVYYTRGDEYNSIIKYLESKPMEVVCPLIGEVFTAWVRIKRTHVSHELIMLEFTLTEVPKTYNYSMDEIVNHLTINTGD